LLALSHFRFILTPYQLHERQLLFYRRLLLSDNIVLHTLAGLPRVRFEMLGIAAIFMMLVTYITQLKLPRMPCGLVL